MLFPKEEEYLNWYRAAGFKEIKIKYIKPQWYKRKHEYGIGISGIKPVDGSESFHTEINVSEEKNRFSDHYKFSGAYW
ncbi:MAG: hypothetical protein IPH42_10845 [Bacteroidetes bacterium]|nr:hypothetical protein [Bacteroidota bacterium]